MSYGRAFHLLTAALVLLGVAAFETAAKSLFFVLVSFVACVLYYRNDRSARPWRLPNWAANAISLGCFLLTVFLVYGSPGGGRQDSLEFRVPVVGRYLMLVQWLLLFKPHGNREYAWVYFITLTHLAGSALLMPELRFAWLYLGYVALAMAALTLYEQKHAMELAGQAIESCGERVTPRFAVRCGLGALALMAPVGFVFAALPRGEPGQLSQISRRTVQPITGFSESVRLGDIARIQQSYARVMQVRVVDAEGQPRYAPPDLLFKGIALDRYDGSRWTASPWQERELVSKGAPLRFNPSTKRPEFWAEEGVEAGVGGGGGGGGGGGARGGGGRSAGARTGGGGEDGAVEEAPSEDGAPAVIRCEISLEPLASRTLFAPAELLWLQAPLDTRLLASGLGRSVRTRVHRRAALNYTTESRLLSPAAAQPREKRAPRRQAGPRPRLSRRAAPSLWLQLPENLPERVHDLALRVVKWEESPSELERAQRICDYLADPANFSYTLELNPEPGVDPVDDFIFRAQEGNCELFASAMTLMLRCVGVEARLVNGFKGGEWNAFGQCLVVRQKDAHSWVEAMMPGVGWVAFDPTPASDRGLAPGGRTGWQAVQGIADFLDRVWVNYVISFDREKQGAFYSFMQKPKDFLHGLMTYAIWRALGNEALLRGDLGDAMGEMLGRFKMSVWPAVILLVALALLAFVLRRRRRSDLRARERKLRQKVVFYADMLRLLKSKGYVRAEPVTPAEFAEQVVAEGGPALEGARLVTWRFYEARFGGRTLSAEQMAEIRRTLKALRRAPGRRQAARRARREGAPA